MEARAEKAGKAIGKSLDSSALIASSVLDQALDMLGRTSRQAGQAKKPVQSAQDKVLAEWKTRQKELGEAWKSYREPLQDLSKLNEALLKNSSDKLDKALLNLSETGKLSLANVGKAAYADAARLASRQMTLMLLDGLFGWVASVGTEAQGRRQGGQGTGEGWRRRKEQPSLQSQVFKQWLLQMNSVWGAYRAPLQDISGMTDELFRNASEKLEKSLFNFATSGKLSLSNFAKTVIDDVARIAARRLSMLALDGLFGWMNGKAGITEAQLASQKPYTSLLEKARAAAGQAAAGAPAAQGAAPMPAAAMDVGAMVATASGQTGDGSKVSAGGASAAGKPVGSWVEQMDASWASLRDQAQDVSGMMDMLFTNAFTNMENALFTFATTGKLSFKDFADSVIQDMARIAARRRCRSSAASSVRSAGSSVAAQRRARGFPTIPARTWPVGQQATRRRHAWVRQGRCLQRWHPERAGAVQHGRRSSGADRRAWAGSHHAAESRFRWRARRARARRRRGATSSISPPASAWAVAARARRRPAATTVRDSSWRE